jgi:hypothetical protein
VSNESVVLLIEGKYMKKLFHVDDTLRNRNLTWHSPRQCARMQG